MKTKRVRWPVVFLGAASVFVFIAVFIAVTFLVGLIPRLLPFPLSSIILVLIGAGLGFLIKGRKAELMAALIAFCFIVGFICWWLGEGWGKILVLAVFFGGIILQYYLLVNFPGLFPEKLRILKLAKEKDNGI